MAERFEEKVAQLPELLQRLTASPPLPVAQPDALPKAPGVYVFYQDDSPVYAGLTRNLRQRMRNHIAGTAAKSAFAFRLARHKTDRKATYRPEGSRKQLMLDPTFRPVFDECIELVRGMQVRAIVVEEPEMRYLLEIYAALELDCRHNDFNSH